MKIRLLNFRVFILLLILFFSVSFVNAATITSTSAGGNWTLGSSWVGGLVPTASDDVEIPFGSILILNSNVSAYSVTISGILKMPSFADFAITTQLVVVASSGSISFDHSILRLPSTVSMYLQNGYNSLGGDCNNNDQIFVGIVQYGVCKGGGANFLFTAIEDAGGINNIVTPGVIGTSQTICSGCIPAPFSLITAAIGSGTISYEWQTNAAGSYSTITSAIADTYSPPVLYATTSYQRRTVSVFGGNTSYSAFTTPVKVTVSPPPLTPIIGTITQPDCKIATGSVFLSGLPSGAWTLTRSPGSITSNGSGTTATISSLAAGDYTFTVSNASGCTSLPTGSGSIVINAVITATWTGSTWINGPPNSSQPLVFSGNFNSSGNLEACSCLVTGGTITIKSGHTLTLTNELNVLGGLLTFNDSASLVQINDAAVNTGNIIYKRNMATNRETDYTYWSSPVANQKLLDISPNTPLNYFYSYSATADNWNLENTANPMFFGIGYIIRGQPITGIIPPGFPTTTFNGVPNNGHSPFPISVSVNKSCLLGNPYPSAIYADKFLDANKTVLDGTLYFWTHNTVIQDRNNFSGIDPVTGLPITTAGSGAYAYTSDDYASYNLTGGVSIRLGNIINGVEQVSNKPTGIIGAGQGFFATGIANGSVFFNNDMRVDIAGNILNNSQFFKTSNTKRETAISSEKDRVWLNLSNTQGAFKQTLIGYITGATNDYDDRFDGESFDGNEFVDFYSVLQDTNLTIQGRALPFDENDLVPLGFRSTINGDFTISIDQVDGLLINQSVYIEDKLTNIIADLKKGNCTFTTVAGTFNDRFVLRFINNNTAKITLANDNFEEKTNKVLVYTKSKQIKVNSFNETIDTVSVYDLSGRQIYQKTNVNTNELSIANLVSSHQTFVVKTSLQSGKVFTDKIIY